MIVMENRSEVARVRHGEQDDYKGVSWRENGVVTAKRFLFSFV